MLTEHHETMRKTFRNPQLTGVFSGQLDADPLPEVRRTAADVHRHIQHCADSDAHQLTLCVFDLIMQAAQHASLRARVVVLHKLPGQASGLLKSPGVEAFIEEASFITEYLGFQNQDFRQLCGYYVHVTSPAIFNKWWLFDSLHSGVPVEKCGAQAIRSFEAVKPSRWP
ncbi:hypothetical protein ALP75_203295 [Pseudomonas syringae pv. actinidiae]|nr:hypothetical protein ALP75_203295 [Pseudomonas syringae pv. actinidiae]